MPPKQTKAEKKAASQVKRKATLERKRAEQQASGESAAEPQAPVASEETPAPAPATPEPSANAAGKKRVTISDADTEPPRKRQRPVTETGSVAGSDQEDGDYEP